MRLEQVLAAVVDGLPTEVLVVEGTAPHRLVYRNVPSRAALAIADEGAWTAADWEPPGQVTLPSGEVVPPEDLPLRRALRIRGEVPWRDLVVEGADGAVRHVRQMVRPIPPGTDAPEAYALVTLDRTDEVRLQQETEQRERLFRSVFDSVPVGVLLAQPDGRIITLNDAYLRTIGVPRALLARAQGFNIKEIETFENAGISEHFVALLDGRAFRREARITSIANKDAWVVYTGIPVFDEREQLEIVIVLLEDVAEQRLAELRLRQMESMEAASRLAGGVAHDINNTITAVAGYAELLLALEVDLRKRRYLAQIQDASGQIARLVQSLSRLRQSGGVSVETTVDAAEIAWEAAQRFARGLKVEIQVDIEVTSGALPVRVPRRQLVDVLDELFRNALEAMPEGGRLRVETALVEPDEALRKQFPGLPEGLCARITVTDTGVGIPADAVHRIFEPYASTKGQGAEKGTGLGLSLVYAFVMEARGAVVARSSEGEGTSVELTLPLDGSPDA